MNRDEAEKLAYMASNTTCGCGELVNKIYDDIESRTCESCKYRIKDGDKTVCEKLVIENYHFIDESYFEVSNNFGCNKWGAK